MTHYNNNIISFLDFLYEISHARNEDGMFEQVDFDVNGEY